MEINEKMHDKVNNTARTEVNSSIICVSILSAIFNDVITMRQNPKRVADVFKIC